MPAYQSLDARRLEGALRPLLRGDVKARAETIGWAIAAEQPADAITELVESGPVPGAVLSAGVPELGFRAFRARSSRHFRI